VPSAWEGFFTDPLRLTSTGWLIIVLVGVSSGAFYFLWVWVLSRTTATRLAVFLALSPITAAILGWLFLAEPITPGLIIGLLAVAAGLWLAHRPTPGEQVA
jgi:drug/metabolite transporter (DMT)-like permease